MSSTSSGLFFLVAGVGAFVVGALAIALLDQARNSAGTTVASFQRARRSLRKIFRMHLAIREAARVRARESHPAMRIRRGAASTKHAAQVARPATTTRAAPARLLTPEAATITMRNPNPTTVVSPPHGSAPRRQRRPA